MKKTTLAKILLTIGLILGLQSNANDERWMHIGPLKSSDATILLDYQLQTVRDKDPWYPNPPQGPMSYTSTTNPIWINVLRENLKPTDRVKALLISYVTSSYRGQSSGTYVDKISEINLSYAEQGRFSALFNSQITSMQINNGYSLTTNSYRQELVIWINDVIYKDPISSSNFTFNLEAGRIDP